MEQEFLDKVKNAFSNYGGFIEQHPVLSLLLEIGVMLGITAIGSALFDNSERDQSEEYDMDAIEERQRAAAREAEEALAARHVQLDSRPTPATVEECLQQSADTLRGLTRQPRLNQVSPEYVEDLIQLAQLLKYLAQLPPKQQQTQAAYALHAQCIEAKQQYAAFDLRWQAARDEWHAQWQRVDQLIQSSRHFQIALETSVGRETLEIDGAFWSHGQFDMAAQALPELEQPEDTTIDAFYALSQQAVRLYHRLTGILQEAQNAFGNSQMRIQLGEAILLQFENRGWRLADEADCAFVNGDERGPLCLLLHNSVGDRLEFTLHPDQRLQVRPAFSGIHNRSVAEHLAQTLQNALLQCGIRVTDVSIA